MSVLNKTWLVNNLKMARIDGGHFMNTQDLLFNNLIILLKINII